jgi:hypothetical protein
MVEPTARVRIDGGNEIESVLCGVEGKNPGRA